MDAKKWSQEELCKRQYDALFQIAKELENQSFRDTLAAVRKFEKNHPKLCKELIYMKISDFNDLVDRHYPQIVLQECLCEISDILYSTV